MATIHTLGDGDATIAVRAIPDPPSQYSYAVVLNLEGPLSTLLRRSAETGVKEALASRRTASWGWLDDRALAVRITRADPAHAAAVIDDVLDAIAATFEEARAEGDDPAFDEALSRRRGGG